MDQKWKINTVGCISVVCRVLDTVNYWPENGLCRFYFFKYV